MKLLVILAVSIFGGVLSAEHFHSFMLGLSVSALAVGSCYWFAFRTTRFPEFALALLMLGMLAKLVVSIAGTAIGLSADLITSPLTFGLSYLFFSIATTYLWFSYRDNMMNREKSLETASA